MTVIDETPTEEVVQLDTNFEADPYDQLAHLHECYNTSVVHDVGMAFSHALEINPCPGIKQVLWFSILSNFDLDTDYSCIAYYWIEHASGELQAVKVIGSGLQPEAVIPFFSRQNTPPSDRPQSLREHISSGWLFPPELNAKEIQQAELVPTQWFWCEIIVEKASSLLSNPRLPAGTQELLEKLVDLPISRNLWGFDLWSDEKELPFQYVCVLPPVAGLDELQAEAELFKSGLDCQTTTVLCRKSAEYPGYCTTNTYNEIMSWEGDIRRNRVQALNAFPWLFEEFANVMLKVEQPADVSSSVLRPLSDHILEVIDTGKPLLQALALHFELKPHTIRNACKFLKGFYLKPKYLPYLLWLMNGMKADHQPKAIKQITPLLIEIKWLAGLDLCSQIPAIEKYSAERFARGIDASEVDLRIDHFYEEELDSCYGYQEHGELCDYLVVTYRSRQNTAEYPSASEIGSLFAEMILEFGANETFAKSVAWHEDCWNDMDMRSGENLHWEPLTSSPMSLGELTAYELSNSEMLFEEGQRMHHCVGSYDYKCRDGSDYIFSLRDSAGHSKSTIQVTKHGEWLTVSQHRAFENTDPDFECEVAGRTLLDRLNAACAGSLA